MRHIVNNTQLCLTVQYHLAILVSIFPCFFSPQVCHPEFFVIPRCFPFLEHVVANNLKNVTIKFYFLRIKLH
jgi:hypothetical protein